MNFVTILKSIDTHADLCSFLIFRLILSMQGVNVDSRRYYGNGAFRSAYLCQYFLKFNSVAGTFGWRYCGIDFLLSMLLQRLISEPIMLLVQCSAPALTISW